MKEISSLNLTQVVALLRATPQTLRRLLSPLDSSILLWRPSPHIRSINEVVGHLIESDQHAYAAPIHAMLAYELPELECWEDHLPLPDQHDERDVLELLAELEVMRHEHATLIANLRPGQLARSGFHPQVGELQVVDFIYDWVFQDCRHIKQIMDLLQMSAWPKMGNFRHLMPPK
ncbi:MAG TPA: DinB family protein [Anaerolineae bacterium]|nr:DinB family protein [Anaerolineae bacterium]HMR62444.1 DinB family protein [Anaerolineae bacterium]